jgi:hypothetical protein
MIRYQIAALVFRYASTFLFRWVRTGYKPRIHHPKTELLRPPATPPKTAALHVSCSKSACTKSVAMKVLLSDGDMVAGGENADATQTIQAYYRKDASMDSETLQPGLLPAWKPVDVFVPQSASYYIKQQGGINTKTNPRTKRKQTPQQHNPSSLADKRNIAHLVHSLAVCETQKTLLQQQASRDKTHLQADIQRLEAEKNEILHKFQCLYC